MIKQYIFVDESGDIGPITKRGSSKIFVMSAVYFTDKLATLIASQAIENLKANLKINEDYEFKYHRSKQTVKNNFFQVAKNIDCRFFGLVIQKSETDKAVAYVECIVMLIKYICECLYTDGLYINLIVDGKGSRPYLTKIKKVVRAYTTAKVENIKFSNSKNDSLLQLADMSSGLIYYKETGKELNKESLRFYNKIRRFYHGPTRNAA